MSQRGIRNTCIAVLILLAFGVNGQHEIRTEQDLILALSGKDPLIDQVLSNRERHRLQMVYTPVDGEVGETIHSITGEYFFPASTVKLPIALLTLEKLKKEGISLDSYLRFNRDIDCGNQRFIDLSRKYNLSFRQMISELMVVSNNDYYNSLYHFLHPATINKELLKKGYAGTNIYRAFTGCDREEQLSCNSFEVLNNEMVALEESVRIMPLKVMEDHYQYNEALLLGSKHENDEGVIVSGPYDFNYNLEIPLVELHKMLMSLVHPANFSEHERWDIREEDRRFILGLMGMYPRELKKSKYRNSERWPDTIYKYILVGEQKQGVRTISKIGLSYGFATETAYVIDGNGKGYFLSISIYVNENDTVNDGDYEYNEVARPFMARVGKILLENN